LQGGFRRGLAGGFLCGDLGADVLAGVGVFAALVFDLRQDGQDCGVFAAGGPVALNGVGGLREVLGAVIQLDENFEGLQLLGGLQLAGTQQAFVVGGSALVVALADSDGGFEADDDVLLIRGESADFLGDADLAAGIVVFLRLQRGLGSLQRFADFRPQGLLVGGEAGAGGAE